MDVFIFALAVCLTTLAMILPACPARADAGVPMLVIVWPSSWLLLLAIIPIEAVVAVRLGIGWKKSFLMAGVANLVSTLVGIPVTWVVLVIIELLLGGGGAFGLTSNLTRILSVTLQSPWLIPYERDLSWMVPSAAAVLCIPFFFMSVYVEYWCARRFLPVESRPLVWRWSWIANGLTYGCIVIGLLGLLISILQAHESEKFGYINPAGRIIPQPATTYTIEKYSEGLAPVLSKGKWQYIDKTGKCVIGPQFDVAMPFSDGMAQVEINRRWGFIDKEGHQIVKPQFDSAGEFSDSLASVRTGDKWGFVDKSGKVVIDPRYEQVTRFSEGLAAVENKNRWGYIGHDGSSKIAPQFNYAGEFSEGLAAVTRRGEDAWGYIDCSGKTVIELPTRTRGGKFKDGMATFTQGLQYEGFIDKTGKVVVEPTLDRAEPFSQGLACVSVGARHTGSRNASTVDYTSSKYGYIDRNGHFVIQPQFKMAESFSEGLAAVEINGKWGFIDKTGKIVIQPQFLRVGAFSDGLAAVGERWYIDLK